METPKCFVFVVKQYAVRETEKWRYEVRKAKIGRYAVRKGGWGVTLIPCGKNDLAGKPNLAKKFCP